MRSRLRAAIFVFIVFSLSFSQSSSAVEGFYKDLFVDGGVGLTGRTSLDAASYLGLSMEYLATEEQSIQDQFLLSNSDDANGVLLYPDGEPRFCCIQLNGGGATTHGNALGAEGRQRIRDFYFNGGSYTGTCAGAFIACNGYNDLDRTAYLHLWPARARTTNLTNSYTGHFIPSDSPLLNYYDFGSDLYIDNVRHNGGCYAIENDANSWTAGTEVLLRYDDPGYAFHQQVSCWAYQGNPLHGRIVVIGSHPEGESSGEKRDLMAAILSYAMDGIGRPTVKAVLENGVPRAMNDNNTTGQEKIGDRQYHHFVVEIPAGVERLTVTVDGDDDYDLDLFLNPGDFAFRNEPETIEATNDSSADESVVIDHPAEGTWYIGVKCSTPVETTEENWGYRYSGNLGVLNGVSYTLTADWDWPVDRSVWQVY